MCKARTAVGNASCASHGASHGAAGEGKVYPPGKRLSMKMRLKLSFEILSPLGSPKISKMAWWLPSIEPPTRSGLPSTMSG
mmetsp:Transcript_53294/g.127136  ORF Transcript_53294/g.127136 Transcript_53294/m.127136 type:complete len:81 (-) Transcript_53294:1076-1318(-)